MLVVQLGHEGAGTPDGLTQDREGPECLQTTKIMMIDDGDNLTFRHPRRRLIGMIMIRQDDAAAGLRRQVSAQQDALELALGVHHW